VKKTKLVSLMTRRKNDEKAVASLANYLKDDEPSTSTSNFDTLIREFTTSEKAGPAINAKLATMVENLIKGRLPKEKLDELMEKYCW